MEAGHALDYRRALEALRNGVPNRDAVRELGTHQREAEDLFLDRLASVEPLARDGKQAKGILIAGDFGTGKSHLLDYLEHLAMDRNYVSSRVVISKETPLFDPDKVYRAAIEGAEISGIKGEAIREMILRLDTTSQRYADFSQWVGSLSSQLSPLFAATVLLREKLHNDPELVEQITRFWLGERLAIGRIKQGLKQINSAGLYSLKSVKSKELALQRYRFLARLIMAAGYGGWVVLIDEVELVGRYSLMQRGRSYAELARWMGQVKGEAYPGLMAVAAITDDYGLAVLQEKSDRDLVGTKFRSKENEEMLAIAGRAEAGMRLIEREAVSLQPPDDSTLAQTYQRLKEIHAKAYGWDPPEIPDSPTTVTAMSRRMRSYVRRWVNEWDLKRLYPGAETAEEEEPQIHLTYEQDTDLEEVSATSSPELE